MNSCHQRRRLTLLEPARAIFPYPNYWHGDFRCPYPVVDDRRAGWRPTVDITPAIPQKVDEFKLPPYAFSYGTAHIPSYNHLIGGSKSAYIRVDKKGDGLDPEYWTFDIASPYYENLIA